MVATGVTAQHQGRDRTGIAEGKVAVEPRMTVTARRFGMISGIGTVFLIVVYAITLAAGLLTLPSPQEPIGDPYFPILEILILLVAPVMVAVMVAVHAWSPPDSKTFSLLALVFMVLMTGLSCSLHFVILTLGRQPEFTALPSLPLFLEFRWPSVVYALDILAWDVFFPLSVLAAAPVFRGGRLASSIRVLMIISGILALGGLTGVTTGDMQLRNIGIVGYAGVFPVAAALLAVLFYRTAPYEPLQPPEYPTN